MQVSLRIHTEILRFHSNNNLSKIWFKQTDKVIQSESNAISQKALLLFVKTQLRLPKNFRLIIEVPYFLLVSQQHVTFLRCSN